MTSASSASSVATGSALATPAQALIPAQTAAAKSADQKLQDLKGALATLKTVHVSSSSQQKSAAKAKLDALKERLKMLRMMSGGDPKALARAAGQLAKEVAQAAKDYAAAGGSPGDAGSPPSGEPPPAQDQSADGQAPAADGAAPSQGAEKTQDGAAGAKPDAPAAQTPIATPGLQTSDPAIDEAKQLAAGARALLESAIARAKREHHARPGDFHDERAALKDADKTIDDAARKVADDNAPTAYGPTGQGVSAPAPVAAIKA